MAERRIRALARRLISRACMATGLFPRLYVRCNRRDWSAWAAWLRKHRGMSIGEGTSVNPDAHLMDWWMVKIGRDCSISFCTFVTHSGYDRIIKKLTGHAVDSRRPIVIGDRCMVGCNVTILSGVTIGDDCAIGAGCVVSRDVPAGTVMRAPEAIATGRTADYIIRAVARATEEIAA